MSFSLLAFSLSTTFTKIGAIAAFAALLGIAVLSLLVFSQAREIKRLREWAGRAPERAADMEQKVSEAASARAQQQTPVQSSVRPVPRAQPIHARPAAAAGPATRVVGEPVPAAPGQVPLPASPQPVTAAGTPVTPAAATVAPTQPPAQGTPLAQPATPVAPATTAGATQAAQPAPPPAAPATSGPKPIPWQQPPPASTDAKPSAPEGSPPAAPASNGSPPRTPAPATAAAAAGTPTPSAARAPTPPAGSPQAGGATPPPVSPPAPRRPAPPSEEVVAKRVQARSGVTGAPVSRERSTPDPQAPARSSRDRPRGSAGGSSRRAIGLIVVGIAVVIVLAVVLLGKGGSSPTKSTGGKSAQTTTGSSTTSAHHKAPKAAPKAANPADTTVSVLNGTEQTGLARRVSTSLQQKGYSQATAQFGNPPGTHEVTVVEYASGHQADAEGVARSLSVSHVQPMEQAVATLAGSARVVVIVGADEATTVP